MKLIVYSVFNTNHMVLLKTKAIEKYLELMEKWKQTNSIYYLRLLSKIVEITKRIKAFHNQSQKNTLYYNKALEKIPIIVNTIFICLSKETNQEYHQNLAQNLYILSEILRDSNILLDQEIYLFLLNTNNIKQQNEGLNGLKKLIEGKKIMKNIEISQILSDFNEKITKTKNEYEENSKKLPKEETFEKFDNEQKYKKTLEALNTINILLKFNEYSS